jgi:hypothetical protein
VPPFEDLPVALRTTWDEWVRTRWSDLQFEQAQTALLVFIVLLAIVALLMAIGFLRIRGRTQVALPAILPVMRRSPLMVLRHLPLVLFLAGIPFFAVALADPLTGFAREEVSYPGRRIALLIDGSTSMVIRFESNANVRARRRSSPRWRPPSSSSAAAWMVPIVIWWR